MPPLKTVLCVDDDRVSRLLIRRYLESTGGYLVAEAKNGQECLKYLSQHKVDLVILDYHLGDTNGSYVCREITSIGINLEVPIIISSMLDSHDIKMQCNCSNIVKIVQKPYLINQLQRDLEDIFRA